MTGEEQKKSWGRARYGALNVQDGQQNRCNLIVFVLD